MSEPIQGAMASAVEMRVTAGPSEQTIATLVFNGQERAPQIRSMINPFAIPPPSHIVCNP